MHAFETFRAVPLIFALALLPVVALAGAVKWQKLAADPAAYIGKEVEVVGYCAQGGVNGDAPGYQCATDGNLYIETPEIGPAAAKTKVDETCGGMDVIERSSFCRVSIDFVPSSVSTSTALEPGKTVTVINTDTAKLKF
jgi:hypothetical protein